MRFPVQRLLRLHRSDDQGGAVGGSGILIGIVSILLFALLLVLLLRSLKLFLRAASDSGLRLEQASESLLSARLAYLGLFVVGLMLVLLGAFALSRSVSLHQHGLTTSGEVTRSESDLWDQDYFIKLAVTDVVFTWQGHRYFFHSVLRHPLGPVKVMFDPSNPLRASIYSVGEMWVEPMSKIALGLLLCIGAGWLFLSNQRKNMPKLP